jgi:hypothetical protein
MTIMKLLHVHLQRAYLTFSQWLSNISMILFGKKNGQLQEYLYLKGQIILIVNAIFFFSQTTFTSTSNLITSGTLNIQRA